MARKNRGPGCRRGPTRLMKGWKKLICHIIIFSRIFKAPVSMGTRKNGARKIGPRKNLLKKLFSVKRMLGNLNDFFIFINWFHYTHTKMFDAYVTILHMY